MRKSWLGIWLLWCTPLLGLSPDQLYLTLEGDPLTSMAIHWIGEEEVALEIRAEEEGEWQTLSSRSESLPQNSGTIHHVHAKNLESGARYRFRIGGPEEFTFTVPSKETLHFAVGGDIYHGNWELCARTTKRIAAASPSFVVLGGDLAYACSRLPWGKAISGEWLMFLKHLKEELVAPNGDLIPTVPIIGNHDVNGRYGSHPEHAPFYYALFGEPIRCLDFGEQMSLICLDSGHAHKIAKKQKKWLKRSLKERKQVSHKIAFYHVASMPSVRSPDKHPAPRIRKHWAPLFEEHGVKLVFEHHDHAYKRTHAWKNRKKDPDGVVYIGDGCWGSPPRKVKPKRRYLAHTEATQHYLLVTVTENRREVDAIASSTNKSIDHLVQEL